MELFRPHGVQSKAQLRLNYGRLCKPPNASGVRTPSTLIASLLFLASHGRALARDPTQNLAHVWAEYWAGQPVRVLMLKLKSHITPLQAAAIGLSEQRRRGNEVADGLAKAGHIAHWASWQIMHMCDKRIADHDDLPKAATAVTQRSGTQRGRNRSKHRWVEPPWIQTLLDAATQQLHSFRFDVKRTDKSHGVCTPMGFIAPEVLLGVLKAVNFEHDLWRRESRAAAAKSIRQLMHPKGGPGMGKNHLVPLYQWTQAAMDEMEVQLPSVIMREGWML
eukprot:5337580-Amphidinium_carterae.5